MAKFPVMQSGFISISDEGLTKSSIHKDIINDNILGRDYRTTENRGFHANRVVDLYEKWRADTSVLNNFEFREKLLTATIASFQINSIFKWLVLQNEKCNLTELHKQFIEDTLRFISGEDRSIQTAQWIALIEVSYNVSGVRLNPNRWFITESNLTGALLPSSMSELLRLWTMRPGGFEDLLMCVFIIFGDRPYITTVAKKNLL